MLPKANWTQRLLFALGKRRAFRIEGDSMLPGLPSGEAVLIVPNASIQVGDVVVARHPFKKSTRIVKRVSHLDGDLRCALAGDNPAESSDSRSFGMVSLQDILGKVVARL